VAGSLSWQSTMPLATPHLPPRSDRAVSIETVDLSSEPPLDYGYRIQKYSGSTGLPKIDAPRVTREQLKNEKLVQTDSSGVEARLGK